ncbi:Endonuclease-reverse transcriptase [Danaus plexippus plexippus]|uniref:Endonuclease-reverse transcriptase n=1 Tax=Danaus plexippus plexippus TaxID=278856 RepID=A0A212EMI6_DANPL|nr:Endonuclease-reverse transcriptase [Danaus plexippus plexippus]
MENSVFIMRSKMAEKECFGWYATFLQEGRGHDDLCFGAIGGGDSDKKAQNTCNRNAKRKILVQLQESEKRRSLGAFPSQEHGHYPLNSEPIPKILKDETAKAINSQKREKTPGSDQITNELLKTTLPVIAPILTD